MSPAKARVTRRRFLRDSVLMAAGAGLFPRAACLGAEAETYAVQFPDMLIQSQIRTINALADKWDREHAKIRTRDDMLARIRHVRAKFREMIGPDPARGELGAVTVSTLQRDGYAVENVMFQSRPSFWVTANLYRPTTGSGPFPAILAPSGHYDEANRTPSYQLGHILLARCGFVVLAYDPIGQGERRYHWKPDTGQYEIGGPGFEHNFFGQPLLLFGENMAQYMAWDGRRGIDYLLTRPEVDPQRIGCAGHSGGASATFVIAALDDRVQCAVCNQPGRIFHYWPLDPRPGSFFMVHDADWHFLPGAAHGVDWCDLLQAIAPRPLLLTAEHFSDAQFMAEYGSNPGFQPARAHLQACYGRLGVPDRFGVAEAGDRHYMSHRLRLATADWFSRWFHGRPGPTSEPETKTETIAALSCTANVSLRFSSKGDAMPALIARTAAPLPPPRRVPGSAVEHDASRGELLPAIRRLLRIESLADPLVLRRHTTVQRRGYTIERVEYLSEPGIYLPTWVMIPEGAKPPFAPLIYVNDLGRQFGEIGNEFGLLEGLVLKGHVIVAADLRGFGDTAPTRPERMPKTNPFWPLYSVETGLAYRAWSFDRCLMGMRVMDLMRVVDYAVSRPDMDRSKISVVASGNLTGTCALFAAALDSRIQAAVCDGGLLSYKAITGADRFSLPASVFVRDVLLHFDLPHVAAAVAPRRLVLLSPIDHLKRPAAPATAQEAYDHASRTYAALGAARRFEILPRAARGGLAEQLRAALAG